MGNWQIDPDLTLATVNAEIPEVNVRVNKLLRGLYNKRFSRFSPDELYLCITTGTGLPWTLPLAITLLQEEPLLEAIAHPGDLFSAVMCVESSHWQKNPEMQMAMTKVVEDALELAQEMGGTRPLDEILGDDLMAAIMEFNEGLKEE